VNTGSEIAPDYQAVERYQAAEHYRPAEQQGFTTEDILWAVGIWSVILTLSPVIVFYMLMVA
jgi:hypothetical protein